MRVIALDTHDGYHEGDEYDVPEHRAKQLIVKGLVKAGPLPKNKMAQPLDNKANPTPAVGEDATPSSSRAALVLPQVIANPSGNGASIPKRRGRPRKNRDVS